MGESVVLVEWRQSVLRYRPRHEVLLQKLADETEASALREYVRAGSVGIGLLGRVAPPTSMLARGGSTAKFGVFQDVGRNLEMCHTF